jgi:hypothetical protein
MFDQVADMHSPQETTSASSDEPAVVEPNLRIHQPADELLSPSIERSAGEAMEAYELKFLVPQAVARQLQHWATQQMQPDPFGNPRLGGAYLTTTLYLDTPQRDVFYRADGFRRRKFRLRRYGIEPKAYLERKTRGSDRVKKRRCEVPLHELPARMTAPLPAGDSPADTWAGEWFRERIEHRGLRPACLLSYERTAFVRPTPDGLLRVTLDRELRGLAASDWDLTPLTDGHRLLPEHVICEFKFRGALPNLFKEVILNLHLEDRGVSKYRQIMLAVDGVAIEDRRHA